MRFPMPEAEIVPEPCPCEHTGRWDTTDGPPKIIRMFRSPIARSDWFGFYMDCAAGVKQLDTPGIIPCCHRHPDGCRTLMGGVGQGLDQLV